MSKENVMITKFKNFDPDKFLENPNNTYGKPIMLQDKTVFPTYDYITGTGGGAPIIKQGNKITLKDTWDIQPFSRNSSLPKKIQGIDVSKIIGAKNFDLNQTYRVYPYGIRQTFQKGGIVYPYNNPRYVQSAVDLDKYRGEPIQGIVGPQLYLEDENFNHNVDNISFPQEINRNSLAVVTSKYTPQKANVQTFSQAFSDARKNGKKIFTYKGKLFNTQLKSEQKSETPLQKSNREYASIAQQRIAQNKGETPLHSGVIVDKRTNQMYLINNKKIVSQHNVLTGQNTEGNSSNTYDGKANYYPFEKKTTPIGDYYLDPQNNFYGYKGYYMKPFDKNNKSRFLAVHTTYDPANRNKYYGTNRANQSYGCVNCKNPTIDELYKNFPKGDTLRVVDSKKDPKFLKQYRAGGTYYVDNATIANLKQKGIKFKYV